MVTKFQPKIGVGLGGSIPLSSMHGFAESVRLQMQGIIDNYAGMIKSIETQEADILREALEPTGEMSREMCPKDTGQLVDSFYLETREGGHHATVEMGYCRGGFPDYGILVHEDLEAHHAEPTGAKFLQYPLLVDAPNIERRIQMGFAVAAGLSEEGGAWHG